MNAVVKPFTQALSFCLVLLIFDLLLLVINTAMLLLIAWVTQKFGIGFFTDGFQPALWGSIVMSVVSSLLGDAFGTEKIWEVPRWTPARARSRLYRSPLRDTRDVA